MFFFPFRFVCNFILFRESLILFSIHDFPLGLPPRMFVDRMIIVALIKKNVWTINYFNILQYVDRRVRTPGSICTELQPQN